MKFAKNVVVATVVAASLCEGAPQGPFASALAPLADGFSNLFNKGAGDAEQKQARDYGHEDHG